MASSATPTQSSEKGVESMSSGECTNNASESNVLRRDEWLSPLLPCGKFWIGEHIRPRVLDLRHAFRPRRTDVLLATYPKSGTTWLKSLLYAVVHRSQHPPATSSSADGNHQHPLLTHNPHELVRFLEFPLGNSNVADLESFPAPRILATHVPYSLLPPSVAESGCRIIYLCRDPKDNFVSMWHFVNKD